MVVEDDAALRGQLSSALTEAGYIVDAVADGVEAAHRGATESLDAVVLDLGLPLKDGLTILRGLDRESSPPIIIVSVIGEEVDKIVGLEMGADDYVAKPANPRELLARIRSVLRRNQLGERRAGTPPRAWWRFAGWRLDPVGRELIDPDDVVINLSDGEFRLLLALVENPRRVLNRDQLLDLSRGMNAEHFDRAIDVQISRLRRKLERSGVEDLIRTVRNEGYMFVADVARR